MRVIRNLKAIILDLLFPPRCLYCRKNIKKTEANHFLCQECDSTITRLDAFSCRFCRGRLPDPINRCHPDEPPVLAAMTLFHQPLIKELIHQLKFKSRQSVIDALTPRMKDYLVPLVHHFSNFIIIPVPLHISREKHRGFNQAELIARTVGAILTLPLQTDVMIRTRSTKPQTGTHSKKDRESNLKGAFQVINPAAIEDKNILLVDDVITSGATISEATATLKDSGAKKVIAFVLART